MLAELKKFYKAHGRHTLPWRATSDPYKILVSEMMLQQTQVDRVVPFYKHFIARFPTVGTLARAPLGAVLEAWQGLGYNRRAKYLHDAAKIIVGRGFPKTVEEIERLPGVGHYTARAIAAFAYNSPEVFVETNIRTVFLHSDILKNVRVPVTDAELLPLVAEALRQSKMQPREFYAALMDYGAHLKRQGVKVNAKSAHYAKQSVFKGSARELRGAILRELLQHQATLSTLMHRIPRSKEELSRELARLSAEGLIKLHGRYFSVPD